jgi:hypothetical protein
MNTTKIMQSANPIGDTAFADSWTDPEGRAAFERIVAADRADNGMAPRPPRLRRRLVIGTALAGTAGAAVAIVGLPGSAHNGAASASAVTKNADGSVNVTIKDYRDLAGLQAKLRAAGIRADVQPISDSCAGQLPAGTVERAVFNGDLSTFTHGYTWKRLFAGSPDNVADLGPITSQVIVVPDEGTDPMPGDPVTSFTVHPDSLPPGDTIMIGFPNGDSAKAGRAMVVDIEKTGTPIQCTVDPSRLPSYPPTPTPPAGSAQPTTPDPTTPDPTTPDPTH